MPVRLQRDRPSPSAGAQTAVERVTAVFHATYCAAGMPSHLPKIPGL